MAKQCVVVQEAVTVPSYQPPRGTRGVAPAAFKKTFLSPIEKPDRITHNTWLDTMRASSPTHSKSTLLSSAPNCHSSSGGGGSSSSSSLMWMMQHPSALDMFNEIINAAEGKQIVMFLDYDGTLSPIVDDPDKAFMSKPMRETVRGLAKCFPTAIVSGRNRLKVYDFVQLAELYYAGSHGMDIKGPVKRINLTKTKANGIQFQPASKYLPMINQVYGKLAEKTKYIPGSNVEHNKFCVSVHFRRVDEELWSTLAEQVRSVLKDYPKLKVSQGRKVLEIRPMIKWDKGRALEFLLESLGFDDCNSVLPVYIGDDCTDEDAFKVLKRRGQGLGILVSKFPKDTNATYTLQEPSEVMEFLQRLVDWKRLTVNGFC